VEGAVASLLESGYHVDVISDAESLQRLERYPVCILAEQDDVAPETVDLLVAYAEGGGSLLVSGGAQTREFDGSLGVSHAGAVNGDEPNVDLHIPVGRDSVTVGGSWRLVERKGTGSDDLLVMGRLTRTRDVPGNVHEAPAAAIRRRLGKGLLACAFGPVFGFYAITHYPRLRRFLSGLFEALDQDRRLMRVRAPTFVHAAFRRRDGRLVIHLVNTASTTPLAPNRTIVEEVPAAGPVEIFLPLRAAPARAHLEPSGLPVAWSHDAAGFEARIPEVGIHDIMVVEGGLDEPG
jgi:hypothetical protein